MAALLRKQKLAALASGSRRARSCSAEPDEASYASTYADVPQPDGAAQQTHAATIVNDNWTQMMEHLNMRASRVTFQEPVADTELPLPLSGSAPMVDSAGQVPASPAALDRNAVDTSLDHSQPADMDSSAAVSPVGQYTLADTGMRLVDDPGMPILQRSTSPLHEASAVPAAVNEAFMQDMQSVMDGVCPAELAELPTMTAGLVVASTIDMEGLAKQQHHIQNLPLLTVSLMSPERLPRPGRALRPHPAAGPQTKGAGPQTTAAGTQVSASQRGNLQSPSRIMPHYLAGTRQSLAALSPAHFEPAANPQPLSPSLALVHKR